MRGGEAGDGGNESRLAEEQVLAAGLRALVTTAAEEEAPPVVEARLLAAFRRQHAPKMPWFRWALGVAVASVLVVATWSIARVRQVTPAPTALAAVSRQSQTPTVEPLQAEAPPRRRSGMPPAPRAVNPEVATEFLPLPYGDHLSSLEGSQVVRIRLPRSALKSFGLPFNEERGEERIQADVLLGEDGLARAIRFVRYNERGER